MSSPPSTASLDPLFRYVSQKPDHESTYHSYMDQSLCILVTELDNFYDLEMQTKGQVSAAGVKCTMLTLLKRGIYDLKNDKTVSDVYAQSKWISPTTAIIEIKSDRVIEISFKVLKENNYSLTMQERATQSFVFSFRTRSDMVLTRTTIDSVNDIERYTGSKRVKDKGELEDDGTIKIEIA